MNIQLKRLIFCLVLLVQSSPFRAQAAVASREEVARDHRARIESRAGNSVDTATGAFIVDLSLISLQGGRIPLEFNLEHNSMLLDERGTIPKFGLGWRHSFEGRLLKNSDNLVVVTLGARSSNFRFLGEGLRCQPLDVQNQNDILELLTENAGDLEGLWRLRRTDGTSWLFEPSGRLLAILNRNKVPIQIERTGHSEKIYTISKGFRQAGGASNDLPISSSISLNSAPTTLAGPGADEFNVGGYINHIVQDGDTDGSGIYTYLKYSGDYQNRRLSRIYDPVTLETIANVTRTEQLPTQGPVSYPFMVPSQQPGHLLRITPIINSARFLDAALISPSGTVLPLSETREGGYSIMTDKFLDENLGGQWTLRVQDFYDEGKAGTIKGIRIDRAIQPSNWIEYLYSGGRTPRVSACRDKEGLIYYQSYDSNGRISTQWSGPFLENGTLRDQTTFTYEDLPGGDLLTTVTDRTSGRNATTYLHDRNFNLKRVVDPLGSVTSHAYDLATGNRTSTTDANGNTTTFTYGNNGTLVSMVEPGNRITRFNHDEFAVASVDNISATVSTYTLKLVEAEGFLEIPETGTSEVIVAYNEGKVVRLRIYDATGARIFDRPAVELHGGRVSTLNGKVSTFGDSLTAAQKQEIVDLALASILTSTDGGRQGNVTTITDALNQKTVFKYDEYNNLLNTTNALENFQHMVYNSDGDMTNMVNKGSQGVENGYDEKGRPASVKAVDDDFPPETVEYDTFGRVTKMTDAGGSAVTFKYDVQGNLIETRNALGFVETRDYDDRGQLLARTDAEGRVTRFEYDRNGNVTATINALGHTTRMEYDAEDRLIRQIDPAGGVVTNEYDAAGRLIRTIDAEGNDSAFEYDAVGNQIASYRGGILVLSTAHNELGLAVSRTDGRGNTTATSYDLVGQETAVTDPLNRTTRFGYDPLGRMDSVTDPLNRVYTKTYEPDDVVSEIKDAGGSPTRFTYTNKNNVASITTPGGRTSRFSYTNSDFVSSYTPPSLTKAQSYTYDGAKRLVRTQHGSSTGAPDILYTYDRVGNMTSVSTQPAGGGAVTPKITRVYDALNRQISNTDADGNRIQHVYDSCGQVIRIVYPDGKTVNYTYDKAKRMRTVTDWAGRVTTYDYNAQDQITSIEFPNHATRIFTYDDTAQLTSRTDFDATGAIIVRYNYTFDARGRIVVESAHQEPVAWQPAATALTYGAGNHLTQIGGVTVTYDADGNVTQGSVGGASTAFQWDARNNLQRAGQVAFNYDVQDRLTGWQDGAQGVKFATIAGGAGSLILVSTPTTGVPTQYVYGIGLAYEVTGDQITVHHYDERGNTVALSGNAGTPTGRLAYSPHGQVIQEAGDASTLFKFGALFGVVEAPNGLNYMRFRWYSPEMMRFISMDSVYGDIDLPTTLNRYVYGYGDPVNYVDPAGELGFLAVIVIAAVAGAAVSVAVEAITAEIEGRPHRWQNYLSAAIGGAVGGAVGVVCAVCGGALDGLTTNLFQAAFDGEAVDWSALTDTVGGAAGSYFGGKLSKGGKKLGKKFLAKLGKKGKQITNKATGAILRRRGATKNLTQYTWKRVFKEAKVSIRLLGKDLSKGVGGGAFTNNVIEPIKDKLSSGGAALEQNGNAFKYIIKATTSPTANIGRGGEYLHYQRYLEALSLAGRPLPNPVMAIPSF